MGGARKIMRGKTPYGRRPRTTRAACTSFQRHASVSRSRNGFNPDVPLESFEGAPSNPTNENIERQDISPRSLRTKTKHRNSVNLQNNLVRALELLSMYEPKSPRRYKRRSSLGSLPPYLLHSNHSNKLLHPKAKTTKKGVDKDFGLDLSYSGDDESIKGTNGFEAYLDLSLTREAQQAVKEDTDRGYLPASQSVSPQPMREGYGLKDTAKEETHLITPGSPVSKLPMGSPANPSWMQEETLLPGAHMSSQCALGAKKIMDDVRKDLFMLTAPVSPCSPLAMQEDHTILSSPASSDSGLWMRRLPATSVYRKSAIDKTLPPTSPSMNSKKRRSNASHYPVPTASVTGQKTSHPSTSLASWWYIDSWTSSDEESDNFCFSAPASPCSPSKRSKEKHVGGCEW